MMRSIQYPLALCKLATEEGVTCNHTPNTEWIGVIDADLIGFCDIRLWTQTALLRAVYVRPDYRRIGHGSNLVCEALKFASDREIKTVKVLAYQPGFYERLGFKVYGSYAIKKYGTVYQMRVQL